MPEFSKLGNRRGFDDDSKGSLFFKVVDLATVHGTRCIVFENVRQLMSVASRRNVVVGRLEEAGYTVSHTILNALNHGVPQRRERAFVVAFKNAHDHARFVWPAPSPRDEIPSLDALLDDDEGHERYRASARVVRAMRLLAADQTEQKRGGNRCMWTLNRTDHVSIRPYALCLRATPSYNYMLVDGVRRPTERELARLQGVPGGVHVRQRRGYKKMQRLFGNTIPVPLVRSVLQSVAKAMCATSVCEA